MKHIPSPKAPKKENKIEISGYTWVEENFVFSPLSIHMTLAILATGATRNSTTQDELLGALGRFRNIQGLESHYYKQLNDYLSERSVIIQFNLLWVKKNFELYEMDIFLFQRSIEYPFHFGNRIWTGATYFQSISGSFVEKLDRNFKADITALPLNSGEAASQINDWVADVTKNKITNLLGK